MKKYPCLKCDNTYTILLKDYLDFNGWVVLFITGTEIFTKADKRIKGDSKMAEAKFLELYSYKTELSHKTLTEIFKL
jgi:hypothetical protein